MEKESIFDQMKHEMIRQKEQDYANSQNRRDKNGDPIVGPTASPLQAQAYRPPTLTERIETLERQVNHLMHLIGTKG